jgi:DNA-binding MarR family transcriptional regulator
MLDLFVLAERLHRQYLECIQLELDVLNIRDINNVRALMLLNIGDEEMAVSELLWRGCYLGSNVSYNLKKLVETGYVVQERSSHDRRVIMVRNSPKGMALRDILSAMNGRQMIALRESGFDTTSVTACRQTLRSLQRIWGRAGDSDGSFANVRAAVFDGERRSDSRTDFPSVAAAE